MTAKQKLFCEEYIQSYDARKAYKAVYNCADISADRNAYRILKNEEVKAYIAELQKEAYENACINAERVALELAEMAFSDDTEKYTNANRLKALELLQKQLGLQTQKIQGSIDNKVEIVIEE